MSQLIRAVITPYEAVHVRKDARLISHNNLASERRKAIAMQYAVLSRYSKQGATNNSDYASQVRRAFIEKPSRQIEKNLSSAAQVLKTQQPADQSSSKTPVASDAASSVVTADSSYSDTAYANQAKTAYELEKVSFELRISKGDLSYVPALDFKVVLQRPDVQFEYMGGFNYVPPSAAPAGEHVNMIL